MSERARGYKLEDDLMRFEDRVGVPCFCGRHRLTYSAIVRGVESLDVVIEPRQYGTLLRLVSDDGATYAAVAQDCHHA